MNTDPQVDFSRLAYFCATTPNTPDSLMALMLLYKKQKKEKKSRPRPEISRCAALCLTMS